VRGTRSTGTQTVRDVMQADVVAVVPEMTIAELVQTFVDEHVRGAPVLGPTGKVVGLVSQTDVLRLLLPAHVGTAAAGTETGARRAGGRTASPPDRDLGRVRVHEIMRPVDHVCAPGDPLARLVGSFSKDGLQRVVVIENDILVGIVTPANLMHALAGDD
jgi:CBS-domain-containing membrane protein